MRSDSSPAGHAPTPARPRPLVPHLLAVLSWVALLGAFPCVARAADEIHWTIIGQTAVTFDWRGPGNSIQYGTTTGYGTTVVGSTPVPLPWSSVGPFYEAKLTGLIENMLYHYSIGGGPDHTFRTPPPRGSSGFTVYAESDIGDSTNYSRVGPVQTLIAQGAPRFVLIPGDLTYGNANGPDAVDKHFNNVMKWSQDAAYMPAWGNHEWDDPPNEDMRNYKGRFDLPNPQSSPNPPMPGGAGEDWSWFDYGNVRVIAYPEPYTSATWESWNAQAAAIMSQGQADPLIRWIVTFGHRPAYSSGHHPGESEIQSVLDAMGDSYSKYVLNLNGHSHNYERTHPQHGVVHLTVGIGGATLEEQSGPCLYMVCPPPAYSAFRAMHHGTVRLLFSATGIVIEAVCGPPGDSGANFNDITCTLGSVFDRYVIGTEGPDQPPVAVSPAIATIRAGSQLTVNVTASDPDGHAITSLAMNAAGLPSPNNAGFTPGPGNTTGTFTWTPTISHLGTWPVAFRAVNALTGPWDTTQVTVTAGDNPPLVIATPSGPTVYTGQAVTVNVTASDPESDPIASLTMNPAGLPPGHGATFMAGPGNTTGTFQWTPAGSAVGNFAVGFTATNALSGSATATIHVLNRPPVAALSVTPASGVAPLLVTANASGSSDPDGVIVSYRFDFGDGTLVGPQAGSQAPHTYNAGNWTPRVHVTDDRGDSASTTQTVTVAPTGGPNLCGNPSFETALSGWNGYQGGTLARISGTAHDGSWFVRVTGPVAPTEFFGLNDSPSWVVGTPVIGASYRFSAWVRSTTSTHLAQLQLREFKSGMLVGGVVYTPPVALTPSWQKVSGDFVAGAAGSNLDVQVIMTPTLSNEVFEVDDVVIQRTDEPTTAVEPPDDTRFAATIHPNPAPHGATLSLNLPLEGALRVSLYDLGGRLVRTVRDDVAAFVGHHSMEIAGPDRSGRALPPGVYLVRVQAARRTWVKRFAIVR